MMGEEECALFCPCVSLVEAVGEYVSFLNMTSLGGKLTFHIIWAERVDQLFVLCPHRCPWWFSYFLNFSFFIHVHVYAFSIIYAAVPNNQKYMNWFMGNTICQIMTTHPDKAD
jgi:hypothetical protein